MTRGPFLLQLAERLRACSAAGDWPALADADREVATSAYRLAAQGTWSQAEQSALAQLGRAHRDAARHCALETQRARTRLNELGERKDGWMAYAVGESEGGQT